MHRHVYIICIFCIILVFGVGCRSPQGDLEVKSQAKVAISSINQKFTPIFSKVGINIPPDSLLIFVFKKQQRIEIWASAQPFSPKSIIEYPITSPLSIGPRTMNNQQFPEGIYYPGPSGNSLAFPNSYDKEKANADGRQLKTEEFLFENMLGTSEELAELSSLIKATGISKTAIIVAPTDFRIDKTPVPCPFCPNWYAELYDQLRFLVMEYI